MTHASLFSGIGGFDLADERVGWENVFHCEWNPFCQKILNYYWPNATSYTDIKTTDFRPWRGRVDVLSGGFPCQPFSNAGKRQGTEDDRYLWPEMLRCIREVAPSYVVGENVDGIFTWSDGMVFETVCADLENEGYEVAAYRIPACATGAPHRRDRWWFVGHAKHDGRAAAQNTEGGGAGGQCDKTGKDKFCQPAGPALSWNASTNPKHTERRQEPQELRNDQPNGGIQKRKKKAGGFERSIADATNPHSQRQPQPGRPLGEIGQRAGHITGYAEHPTGEGLPQRRQTDLQQFPKETEERMDNRFEQPDSDATHNGHQGLQRDELGRASGEGTRTPRPTPERFENEHWLEAATRLCRLDDGLPGRLDAIALSCKQQHAAGRWRKESLKAYGNAIVPAIAQEIFEAIKNSITTPETATGGEGDKQPQPCQ